jgi:hypothetical protein
LFHTLTNIYIIYIFREGKKRKREKERKRKRERKGKRERDYINRLTEPVNKYATNTPLDFYLKGYLHFAI